MFADFLWSFTLVLTLVPAGLLLRVFSLQAAGARPVPVEIRRVPAPAARPR
jgi:hypothetical protein